MSSSPRIKPQQVARLALAAIPLLLTACQEHLARRDTIAFHAGEAAAYNRAVHTIDPWPAASARTDIQFNAKRVVDAIERYEAPRPPEGAEQPSAGAMTTPAP